VRIISFFKQEQAPFTNCANLLQILQMLCLRSTRDIWRCEVEQNPSIDEKKEGILAKVRLPILCCLFLPLLHDAWDFLDVLFFLCSSD